MSRRDTYSSTPADVEWSGTEAEIAWPVVRWIIIRAGSAGLPVGLPAVPVWTWRWTGSRAAIAWVIIVIIIGNASLLSGNTLGPGCSRYDERNNQNSHDQLFHSFPSSFLWLHRIRRRGEAIIQKELYFGRDSKIKISGAVETVAPDFLYQRRGKVSVNPVAPCS